MALIAARRLAVAAMSVQQPAAADRAIAHAIKDVWTKVEAAVQRSGRTKAVSGRTTPIAQPACWDSA